MADDFGPDRSFLDLAGDTLVLRDEQFSQYTGRYELPPDAAGRIRAAYGVGAGGRVYREGRGSLGPVRDILDGAADAVWAVKRPLNPAC